MNDSAAEQVGVVVIGRDEGERLKRCLRSVLGRAACIVYVDSGSADGSVAFARSAGVNVVELDMSKPFSMARGRNAGFRHVLKTRPGIPYVQFVDGDCEVAPGWIEAGQRTLNERPDITVVCGRRRERLPEASIYNRLCDIEWNTPPGETKACGGDAMMRVSALRQVGGFNEGMIAGEEAELCIRLRANGGKVLRLANEMTLHDAAMSRLGQWWKRTIRAGYAYAEGARLHGRAPRRHNVRQVRSALFWGVVVPVSAVVGSAAASVWAPWPWLLVALPLSGYSLLGVRVYLHRRCRREIPKDAVLYAAFCVLAKLPQAIGVLRCQANYLLRRQSILIEYKNSQHTTEGRE